MFELLFSRPCAVKRHQDAPLAAERAAYLKKLVDQGSPLSVVRRAAFVCRWLAQRIKSWPRNRALCDDDLKTLAISWARRRATNRRRAVPLPSPKESFHSTARGFLRDAGKWVAPAAVAGPYEDRIQAFLVAQQARGLAPATCIKRIKHARKFVAYLEQHDVVLEQVRASHLDAYFQHLAASRCRLSMGTAAVSLRAWLRYCEQMGHVHPGLAKAVMAPRIYRDEGVPVGPTWEQVSLVIAETEGAQPERLRARAILLLLAIYGVRSGEVCRLQLDDIDWQQETIRFTRSKSGRRDIYPLEATVGNAILGYLRHARPLHSSRVVFLTLHAPFRPLSGQALYHIVHKRLAQVIPGKKGRNPHALRHACARHLVDAGCSLKEIGDHLGHRSAEATRIYTKVDVNALRLVAMDDLGGLA